jgi:predicted ATPase
MADNNSKIEIKDFGPISKGEIELKPLTTFIGPNNSGKSYAAMLIHSLYRSYYRIPPLRRHRYFDEKKEQVKTLKNILEKEGIFRKNWIKVSEIVGKKYIMNEFAKIAGDLMLEGIKNEIENSYSCKIDNLVKIGKKNFIIKMTQNLSSLAVENLNSTLRIIEYPEIHESHFKDIEEPESQVSDRGYSRRTGDSFVISGYTVSDMYEYLLRDILSIVMEEVIGKFFRPSYYLPAARSGILQAHKALMSGVIRNISRIGLERLDVPRLSGVVSDFISTIIEMPSKKGPFFELACELEKEIISGSIVMKNLEQYRYPEIEYEYKGSSLPLHRASSTVSELAPLILYLKYVITPGDTLVMEEPEAHLYPQNQSILAKYLVKLIRKGVNLILTTHSEFLLEKFSNFIMLSSVDTQKRSEKYGYTDEDYLLPEEVAVHTFSLDKHGETAVKKVEITKEEGISQEEFLRVHESLYDETYKLYMNTQK